MYNHSTSPRKSIYHYYSSLAKNQIRLASGGRLFFSPSEGLSFFHVDPSLPFHPPPICGCPWSSFIRWRRSLDVSPFGSLVARRVVGLVRSLLFDASEASSDSSCVVSSGASFGVCVRG
ncbi:hypothetical protein YC2023_054705 [Brassica napus]